MEVVAAIRDCSTAPGSGCVPPWSRESSVVQEDLCQLCEEQESILTMEGAKVCGGICLLRQAEGRFDRQMPDRESSQFERVATVFGKAMADGPPEETLMVVAPFDGIGGLRRALELLRLKPAVYLSIEMDEECQQVVRTHWPEAVEMDRVEKVSHELVKKIIDNHPKLKVGLIGGGPP